VRDPAEDGSELMASRRELAQEIRRAIEPLRGEGRWQPLRNRALLIELAETEVEVEALLGECQKFDVRVRVRA
jgi:hypothetical protein